MRFLPLTASLVLLLAGPALAADMLPSNDGNMRGSLDSGGVHDWSGTYVGVNVGYGRGRSQAVEVRTGDDDTSRCAPTGTAGVPTGMYFCNVNGQPNYTYTPTPSFNKIGDKWGMPIRGALAGVTVGINRQKGRLVYGAEADWGWMGFRGTSGPSPASRDDTTLHTQASDYMTARARVGYAWDRFLAFGTVGAAMGRFNSWVDDPDMQLGIYTAQTTTQPGYAIGGGVEYALTDMISLKLDYLHMGFTKSRVEGDVNVTCDTSSCPAQWKLDSVGMAFDGIAAWQVSHSVDIGRAGVNFKF